MNANAPKSIWQIDAFTDLPLRGNAAGVVFDADDLSPETMQAIARETNLSETVFILRASDSSAADYRVRIFTPRSELPFAGHPTLAAAWAVLRRRGGKPRVGETLRQECGIGIIPIEVREPDTGFGPLLMMTQATPSFSPVANLTQGDCARMLGCHGGETDLKSELAPCVVSTGAPWLIVAFRDAAALACARPDLAMVERVARDSRAVGVTCFAQSAEQSRFRLKLRTFAPGEGIAEYPVCGSGNGAVAAFVARHNIFGHGTFAYRAEQGFEVLRRGEVLVDVQAQRGTWIVRVGGRAALAMEGQLYVGI